MSVISDQDVQEAVESVVGPGATIVNTSIEAFSKDRLGMMSNHYSLTVEISQPPAASTRKITFFVKTTAKQLELTDEDWIHKEEIEFLRDVHPRLLQVSKDKWSPECYLAKPEIIVFEDLRSQGYAIRQSGIYDRVSVSSALSALAKFHASSIALEASLGKTLDQVYPGKFREKIFTDHGKGGKANKLGFDTMALLAKDFEMNADLIPKILDKLFELVKMIPGQCNVICHGDLWRTNIMFKDTVVPPHCLLVDYQMLRYTSPSVDLAMLILTHLHPEESRDEIELVQHYYDVLQKSTVDGSIPNWKDFYLDYQEKRLIGLAYAATAWPRAVFTKFMNDPEALRNWYFCERYSTYKKCMDDDKEYEERLKMRLHALLEEGKKVLS